MATNTLADAKLRRTAGKTRGYLQNTDVKRTGENARTTANKRKGLTKQIWQIWQICRRLEVHGLAFLRDRVAPFIEPHCPKKVEPGSGARGTDKACNAILQAQNIAFALAMKHVAGTHCEDCICPVPAKLSSVRIACDKNIFVWTSLGLLFGFNK